MIPLPQRPTLHYFSAQAAGGEIRRGGRRRKRVKWPQSPRNDHGKIGVQVSETLRGLKASDSLRNSNPVLDSFYLSRFSGAIGQMYAIDALLSSLSDSTLMADSIGWQDALNEARALNEQLTDTNLFIANAHWANARYLDMLEFSIDTLQGETADSLEQLAYACPLIAGKAVYRARTLLAMVLPGLYFDDLALCNAVGVFKPGHTAQEGERKQSQFDRFYVYPVPATHVLRVHYPLSGSLQVFDVLGRNCATYTLQAGGDAVLDVSALPRGIKTYRFLAENGEVYYGKIILE